MESYDYRYTTTSLNNRTAARSADGDWVLVIPPTDPGVPNWLDTGGRREGYMLVRWVLADDPPHPTRVVEAGRPGRPVAGGASDLGGDVEAGLVVGHQGPVLGQVEAGVLEAVVVAAGPPGVAGLDVAPPARRGRRRSPRGPTRRRAP